MFDLMPFGRKERSLANYFDHFEKNFFGDMMGNLSECKTDIIDQGDKYILQAELPGFQKEDIRIDLNNDLLTISAEHREDKEEKDKEGNFVRRERHYGSYARSFDVSGIQTDHITADYKNGVLELALPKSAPAHEQTRRIELK